MPVNLFDHDESDQFIHSLKRGGQESMGRLYDVYAPALFGWILKNVSNQSDAGDILVNTFVRAGINIKQFKPSKSSFLIWLVQLINQECCSYYKTKGVDFKIVNTGLRKGGRVLNEGQANF